MTFTDTIKLTLIGHFCNIIVYFLVTNVTLL